MRLTRLDRVAPRRSPSRTGCRSPSVARLARQALGVSAVPGGTAYAHREGGSRLLVVWVRVLLGWVGGWVGWLYLLLSELTVLENAPSLSCSHVAWTSWICKSLLSKTLESS